MQGRYSLIDGRPGPLITPLRISYDESYAKAFPFEKMVSGMPDPEMIEDTARIVNEAIKGKIQVNLIRLSERRK